MREYTAEELKQVESYAGLCFTPRQIALILNINKDDFLKDFKSNELLQDSYNRGVLLTEAQVRKATIDLAKGGSSAAYADYQKLAKNRIIDLKTDK